MYRECSSWSLCNLYVGYGVCVPSNLWSVCTLYLFYGVHVPCMQFMEFMYFVWSLWSLCTLYVAYGVYVPCIYSNAVRFSTNESGLCCRTHLTSSFER